MNVTRSILTLAATFFGATLAVGGEAVNESARSIPVACQVDVVVVGGSTTAVAAAVEAAATGAKVFLVAERPYLGDDMTATLRLWPQPGDDLSSPLARRIFDDRQQGEYTPDPRRLSFRYSADRQAARAHADTDPPSVLNDGTWGNAAQESVQYDDDVNITADLEQPRDLTGVRLMAYLRESSDPKSGFKVGKVAVFTSNDGKDWQPAGAVQDAKAEVVERGVVFNVPVTTKARYVKLAVTKSSEANRLVLGEIELLGAGSPAAREATGSAPRPMHVKKTLDDALLAAGVQYLYSCYATDVLHDAEGQPCGIVMANRAGRQAVIAKTIIDATQRAVIARMAGAKFRPYPAGPQTMKYVVIGGQVQTVDNLTGRIAAPPYKGKFPNAAKTSSGEFSLIEYTVQIAMSGDTDAAWAAAEQTVRSKTYHPEQQFTADALYQVPPDPVHAVRADAAPWQGSQKVPLDALRPADVSRVYLLGGCADVSRETAERLLQPGNGIVLGMRVGKAAAEEAARRSSPAGVRLAGKTTAEPVAHGDVRESLGGTRPALTNPTIEQDARGLPVLGHCDVVVIGGGTSGAPAGIAAARQGVKTLVVEQLHGLGGVGTLGAIASYYWGNPVGFTATLPGDRVWVIEQKMQWWRDELLKAGGEPWFGCVGCGAFVDGDRVCGAVVVTPRGRGVVLAKAVIDATGNADVAVAAGAKSQYTDASEFGMQGTGLPPRNLGATGANTDFSIVDETDMVDVWHIFVYGKDKYPTAFDQGKLIDTRERRRVVGDFTLTILDQINGRTYPDTVCIAFSNFDTHGYTVDPYLLLEHPEKRGLHVYIPYRCCLAKGLDGIFVAGLGLSAHRDAIPLVRMQRDLQNLGYAVGVAGAMTARSGGTVRDIDMRALQRHLVEIGNLPESVLTTSDSYPLSAERVAEAVESIKKDFHGAAVILAQPDQSLPMLRKAYAESEGDAHLAYAQVLAIMGDPTGVDTLIAAVRAVSKWDQGWNYRGMGQFGRALSPLDGYIVALGRAGDRRALPAILEKVELLTAADDFSHHRAVGLAIEAIGDRAAAKPLAQLLARPEMSGHVHASIEVARERNVPGGTNAVQSRRESLRELMLARALYRCGDYEGVGAKILQQYVNDLRGHLSRHAQAVLDASIPSR
jgi:flavin-dependent dehydrogenase